MSSDSRYLQENQQQRQRSRNGFGADPLAIQQAIRDIHTSFSLLFGGGIHRRLLRTRQAESSKDWVLEVKVTAEDGDNNKKKNNDGSSGGHRTSFTTHRRQNSDESDLSNIMLTTEQNWEVGIPGDTDEKSQQTSTTTTKRLSFSNGSSSSSRRSCSSRKKNFTLKKLSGSFNSSFNSAGSGSGSMKQQIIAEEEYSPDYRYGGME